MLPLNRFRMPHSQGTFGATRKHDMHTGIDLYCNPNVSVRAIESGKVVNVAPFTGPKAGLDWWNDTECVIVQGASGYFLYGEVAASVTKGQLLKEGEVLGSVKTVLKKNKGLPMTMLHL